MANTHGVGIRPDDGALRPHGTLAYPFPLCTKGLGEGGPPGRGIKLQRRVLAYPGSLANIALGYESWRTGLTGGNTADPNW